VYGVEKLTVEVKASRLTRSGQGFTVREHYFMLILKGSLIRVQGMESYF
jgi:hypothetical protein